MLNFRSGLAGLYLVASTLLTAWPGAAAHADDMRPVLDRIDRLERDMNQLQRQVYRNQPGTAPTPGAGDGNTSLDTQIRMDQLEAQLRTLTGQLEEIQYNISQLSNRFEKTKADDELRFQQLEGHGAPPQAAAAETEPRTALASPTRGNAGAGDMGHAPSTSVTLGAVQNGPPPASPPQPGAPTPATAPAGSALPNGSSLEQYNYAFGLLRDSDYAAAEAAFRAFLQKHPNDPLADNALYWLGETYFKRGDYPAAASAFAEGYQKYPQGPKAPDDLLKMGISLADAGRKQEACFSFARLERDFPQMAPFIKDREVTEKKKAGC